MTSFTSQHHTMKGYRLLAQGAYADAAEAFARALWSPGGKRNPDALAGRAQAMVRCDVSLQEKIDAVMAARAAGYADPRHWALSVRFALVTCHHLLDHLSNLTGAARNQLRVLRETAADDVARGTMTYRRLIDAGDRAGYPWGAALVSMGDWTWGFEPAGADNGASRRFPFRDLAAIFYRPVAESDLANLFTDAAVREEIDRLITGQARRRLDLIDHKTGPDDDSDQPWNLPVSRIAT
jgi:hypothetical protein